MMKKAKVLEHGADDVSRDKENKGSIAKVLTDEQKKILFETAASKDEWAAAFCAAILAVNTTCRGIELKHLRWRDVDLFERTITIRRSKNQAGHRAIPLTKGRYGGDCKAAPEVGLLRISRAGAFCLSCLRKESVRSQHPAERHGAQHGVRL